MYGLLYVWFVILLRNFYVLNNHDLFVIILEPEARVLIPPNCLHRGKGSISEVINDRGRGSPTVVRGWSFSLISKI
jgi:hypothetical protein